uniref:Aspartic proteinase Asp1 n=1 Tax=Solanum tuberosum TaxID=4113 RepID=M1C543_SOLTU
MGDLRNGCLILLLILMGFGVDVKGENLVFNVKHKYGGRNGNGSILNDLKAHDNRRHSRMLTVIDFKLGGNGLPTDAALVPFLCLFSCFFGFELWIQVLAEM